MDDAYYYVNEEVDENGKKYRVKIEQTPGKLVAEIIDESGITHEYYPHVLEAKIRLTLDLENKELEVVEFHRDVNASGPVLIERIPLTDSELNELFRAIKALSVGYNISNLKILVDNIMARYDKKARERLHNSALYFMVA